MANKFRRWMLAAFMTVTMVAGLAGGLAHTGAAMAAHSSSVPSIHGQLAPYCPAPPYECGVPTRG